MIVPVYDIQNCGPRHRFTANGKLVHNSDKINLQNLPSRGPNGKHIKNSIVAPAGYVLIDADSAQIEARVLAWLAEQEDVVATFAANGDVYKRMAAKIFGKVEEDISKAERQIGKVVILGAGYGVGHVKLQIFLKMQAGVDVDLTEAKRIIDIYRSSNHKISQLWKDADMMLRRMNQGDSVQFGRPGVLTVVASESGIRLPNGLYIQYNGLTGEEGERGTQYSYKTRKGPNNIYGGKVIENVCQALARGIIGEQMLRIAKRYRVVLTVHDSVVACVPAEEAEEAQAYIEQCMRWTPEWAAGLPVNCESEVGTKYGG